MKKLIHLLFLTGCVSLVAAQPTDPKALHETAKGFMRTGDFDNAIIVLTRALQNDSKKNSSILSDSVLLSKP